MLRDVVFYFVLCLFVRTVLPVDVNKVVQIYHTFAVLQCVARGLTATADPRKLADHM